jgi:AcrR family transcriptional regulator
MGRPPTISREQILDSARRVFTLNGFEKATLAAIAGELGVTPAAILRHFESKQALFDASMRHTVALPQCILDLATVDASADPRVVLGRLASEWVPFAEKTLSSNLALQMHERSRHAAIVIPFDTAAADTPPRRGFALVSGYFERAAKAGVIRVDDPRNAALLFMGSLFGYVFLQQIMNALPQPIPLHAYINSLLDLWTRGAIVEPQSGGSRARSPRPRKADRSSSLGAGRRGRAARVLPVSAPPAAPRPVRDDRSEDRQRGVARRRSRGPRSRR